MGINKFNFLLTKETQTNFFMCDLANVMCAIIKHKSPIIEKTKYLNK